jgi:hypothetical protein
MEDNALLDKDSLVGLNQRVSDLLVELSLYDDSLNKELNVVLLSDYEEIKRLNYFIFNGIDSINYYTMDKPYDQDLSIISQMDIVIYNKSDKELEDKILKNIYDKSLNCKFIYLANDRYFRKIDILDKYFRGVDRVLKVDIELKDYIFELQRELQNNFYSKRLSSIQAKEILTTNYEFLNRIQELIDSRIFFSSISYNYESDIDIYEYNLKKIIRELDSIYIDQDSKTINFILLDIMPNMANDIIKERVNNFSIYLEDKEQKSAFELLFN